MRIMVLADGETYSPARGCVLADVTEDVRELLQQDELFSNIVEDPVAYGLDPADIFIVAEF